MNPPPGIPEHVRDVFRYAGSMWEALMIRNRRRALLSLCREVRWDGAQSKVAIVVDEEAVANWIEGWNRAGVANVTP